jgi:hypothetical protein
VKPSVCRIIKAMGPRARNNGADQCPGIITRVWSTEPDADGAWLINATLFPDTGSANPATSIKLYADEPAARAALEANVHATVAFWPPRES